MEKKGKRQCGIRKGPKFKMAKTKFRVVGRKDFGFSLRNLNFEERRWKMAEMTKPPPLGLFLGQAPSATMADSDPALTGHAENRLAALAGISVPRLWQLFGRRNLLADFPGRRPPSKKQLADPAYRLKHHRSQGDEFDLDGARKAATGVEWRHYALVVLLGKKVAAAFPEASVKLLDRRMIQHDDDDDDDGDGGDDDGGGDGSSASGVALIPSMRPSTVLLTFPHPSGVSHFWNSPSAVARASRVLRACIREARRQQKQQQQQQQQQQQERGDEHSEDDEGGSVDLVAHSPYFGVSIESGSCGSILPKSPRVVLQPGDGVKTASKKRKRMKKARAAVTSPYFCRNSCSSSGSGGGGGGGGDGGGDIVGSGGSSRKERKRGAPPVPGMDKKEH